MTRADSGRKVCWRHSQVPTPIARLPAPGKPGSTSTRNDYFAVREEMGAVSGTRRRSQTGKGARLGDAIGLRAAKRRSQPRFPLQSPSNTVQPDDARAKASRGMAAP